MMKLLFTAILVLQALVLTGQQLAGVWEGAVQLGYAKTDKMNIRLELMQEGDLCFGVLYCRGYEKKVVFGCDYIVQGGIVSKALQLQWVNVQRVLGMSNEDCRQMAAIKLQLTDSVTMSGTWQWMLGETVSVNCRKVNSEISFDAADEFAAYKAGVFKTYAERRLFLKITERFPERLYEGVVDSSELIVDFTSIDTASRDSLAVFLNGSLLATSDHLNKAPLRLRLIDLPPGENALVLANTSSTNYTSTIRVTLRHRGDIKTMQATPTGATNMLLYFRRR